MRSLLSLDDTSPMIGQERIAVSNPQPYAASKRPWYTFSPFRPRPRGPIPVTVTEYPEPSLPPIITPPIPQLPDDTLSHFVQQLIISQSSLIEYVTRLEARIEVLERRTWWSMLKAQVRSWFK